MNDGHDGVGITRAFEWKTLGTEVKRYSRFGRASGKMGVQHLVDLPQARVGSMLALLLGFIAAPAIEIQNEEFPLADVAHCGVTEPGEGVLDRLSLGIEYGAFWHYPDVCFHAVSITLPVTASCSAPFAGREKGVFETHLDNPGQLLFR